MSAGAFVRTKYEASTENQGGVYGITLQPETLQFDIGGSTNDPPAGAIDQVVTAYATPSRRKKGMRARYVTFEWDAGQVPTGYTGDPVRIPILTPVFFATAVAGAAGTYLGGTGTVVGRSGETAK